MHSGSGRSCTISFPMLSNIRRAGARSRSELPARAAPGGFSITVEDSGPGIPEAERERIFERFYRLDRSRSRETGGRGLGLAIALEIAKAHGGDIAVGSSQLGGSAFTVRIPAAPVGSQGQKQPGA